MAEVAFAAEGEFDFAFLACLDDEVEELAEVLRGELEVFVVFCSAHWDYCCDSPVFDVEGDEKVFELREVVEVVFVDAGDDVS